MKKHSLEIPPPAVESVSVELRSRKVILDSDLARIYGVATKAFNQAVKRNSTRFPDDFLFRLTPKELAALNRSRFVTGSQRNRDALEKWRSRLNNVSMMCSLVYS